MMGRVGRAMGSVDNLANARRCVGVKGVKGVKGSGSQMRTRTCAQAHPGARMVIFHIRKPPLPTLHTLHNSTTTGKRDVKGYVKGAPMPFTTSQAACPVKRLGSLLPITPCGYARVRFSRRDRAEPISSQGIAVNALKVCAWL
jgi:hypothetical protein